MATKITPEQQADLQAHSGVGIPVQDDAGNIVCYMVGPEAYQDFQTHQRLQDLLKAGDNSPDVSVSDAFERIRRRTHELSNKLA